MPAADRARAARYGHRRCAPLAGRVRVRRSFTEAERPGLHSDRCVEPPDRVAGCVPFGASVGRHIPSSSGSSCAPPHVFPGCADRCGVPGKRCPNAVFGGCSWTRPVWTAQGHQSVRLMQHVCSAPGFLDSGLTVFASTLPRPARRGRVAPGRGFDSRISPASTVRCMSA